jgi:hypothetical protein
MLMRPKHPLDRLLTLRASGVHHLMGSFTAQPAEECLVTLGCPARGPAYIAMLVVLVACTYFFDICFDRASNLATGRSICQSSTLWL